VRTTQSQKEELSRGVNRDNSPCWQVKLITLKALEKAMDTLNFQPTHCVCIKNSTLILP